MSGTDMTMTYSAILRDKDNKKIIRISFERDGINGREVAEGILPDGVIVRQNGYTAEEIKSLEDYIRANADDIMSKAKVISNPLKWL